MIDIIFPTVIILLYVYKFSDKAIVWKSSEEGLCQYKQQFECIVTLVICKVLFNIV